MNKRLFANILKIAIGVGLTVCGCTGMIDDYWGGMGTALIVVGCLSMLRMLRYNRNQEYKDQVNIEVNDERNRYLRMKAWFCSGYSFVLIAAVASIVFKVMKYDHFSLFTSGCVCLIVMLYWFSYLFFKRKY